MLKINFKAKINTSFLILIINITSLIIHVKMYKKILFIRKFEPFSFKLIRAIVKTQFI